MKQRRKADRLERCPPQIGVDADRIDLCGGKICRGAFTAAASCQRDGQLWRCDTDRGVKQRKNKRSPFDIERLLESELPKVLKFGTLAQPATLGRGTTLSPNEERPIFTYLIPPEKLDSLYAYLGMQSEDDNPFPIEVIYTSIYEDDYWQMDNDKMDQPAKVD